MIISFKKIYKKLKTPFSTVTLPVRDLDRLIVVRPLEVSASCDIYFWRCFYFEKIEIGS